MTEKKRPHGNRISLYPLSLEVALSNALKVSPPSSAKRTPHRPARRKSRPKKLKSEWGGEHRKVCKVHNSVEPNITCRERICNALKRTPLSVDAEGKFHCAAINIRIPV